MNSVIVMTANTQDGGPSSAKLLAVKNARTGLKNLSSNVRIADCEPAQGVSVIGFDGK